MGVVIWAVSEVLARCSAAGARCRARVARRGHSDHGRGVVGRGRPVRLPSLARAAGVPARDHDRDGEPSVQRGRRPISVPEQTCRGVWSRRQLLGDHASEPPELHRDHLGRHRRDHRRLHATVRVDELDLRPGRTRGWWPIDARDRVHRRPAGTYAKKHNPAAYYTKLAGAYAQNAVPLGTTAAGALISICARTVCPATASSRPTSATTSTIARSSVGDAWLARWVPKILASRAYRSGGTALFITYDEGSGSDNRVYTVVATPTTRKGTVSHAAFTHYSLLKTQESLLGLRCLGHACDAGTASMRTAFGLSVEDRGSAGASSTASPPAEPDGSTNPAASHLRHHPWPLRRPKARSVLHC